MSKEKLIKKELKINKPHPKRMFRLGRHVITHLFAEYELNSKELKELNSKGCKAWLVEKKEVKKD